MTAIAAIAQPRWGRHQRRVFARRLRSQPSHLLFKVAAMRVSNLPSHTSLALYPAVKRR